MSDYTLHYSRITNNIAKLFLDTDISKNAMHAYNYIVLNLKSTTTGESRPVVVKDMADYLGISSRSTRRVLGELERIEAIVPKSKTSRRIYILPDVARLNEEIKERSKQKAIDKVERKIELIGIVLKKQHFSPNQEESFRRMFAEKLSFDKMLTEIEKLTYRQMTVAEEYRLKEEFKKVDAR